MKACFHKTVCKYRIASDTDLDGLCAIAETCKFCVGTGPDELKKGKKKEAVKRHYKKRGEVAAPAQESTEDHSGITEKQFRKAKLKIAYARQHKKLTENQEKALEAMKGLWFGKMNEEQKRQIISIANDL